MNAGQETMHPALQYIAGVLNQLETLALYIYANTADVTIYNGLYKKNKAAAYR